MRVVVLQSNYIPWKGYFDLIHDAELFIFHDDLQYTKNDWRNRNHVKTPKGAEWITIPVGTDEHRLICDVRLPDRSWARSHWGRISQCYARAPFFRELSPCFKDFYLGRRHERLAEFNVEMTRMISHDLLKIPVRFADSRDYSPEGKKLDRLMDLVRKAGATTYISGPSGQGYLEPERFREAGVELIYKSYSGYPEYPQLFPPFTHTVSILDLLFNVGAEAAPAYIWGWRNSQAINPITPST